MRLWHYKLIPFLPKSQLVAQWRELNAIFSKQTNHILINYIYDYPKSYLYNYTQLVINELKKRNYNIRKWDNFLSYFQDAPKDINKNEIFKKHDDEYLKICCYNLKEKYLRGQADFSDEYYNNIKKFI